MRIIELCLSPGRGGLERYAAGLVSALAGRGHRVSVVARPGSEFAALAGQDPVVTITPARRAPLRGALRLAHLARSADVIHIHRSADLPVAAAAKWLTGGRVALIYTRHMAITRNRRRSPVHRLLHRAVDRLLTITAKLAGEARANLPLDPARITVLPPGVAATARRGDCGAIRPPDVAFVAGCFSRIEPAKGQHHLVAAIGELARADVSAGAVIAGPVMDEAYAAMLRRRAQELGIAARLRFLGALADAHPAMACCDAVVLPSAAETLGLVLVEAMQMGIPVVGSAAGGVPEVIADGETGLTYPAGDHAALANRLARLAGDREFAAGLARAGQAAARERYDANAHITRLEQIFRAAAPR